MKWQEPPPSARADRATKYDAVALQLRQHPKRWALIIENNKSTSTAADIKNGRMKAFQPAGAFEAVNRQTSPGRWSLYARYIGDDDLADTPTIDQ